ncbi:PP2C family protein-serine/threonine phosphatase [Pseudonocardia sp. TRM90224]|uniref:PP2C family protein-serine/threonine phosphatase n=1 Tax=Pseudonocardia sp. TRM90224 TaxID=2812678 RepID=UPI001E497A75|nr:GAF domain-containing SpoIIE family protein phosphatase [Pseudonocardia sp. TRM90224]
MTVADPAWGESEERLRRLDAVTDADLAHLDLEDLLNELLERVRNLLSVDTAAVLLLPPSRKHLVATVALGIDEEVQQGVSVPLGKGFAGRIAAERRPVVLTEVSPATVHNPLLVERGIQSLLGVPLVVGTEVLGVLHVGSLAPRTFTDDDVNLLQLVGDRIALATQARISRSQLTAATTLQTALLPTELPVLDGVEFAARYVPGEGAVGGDWYDVFVLPSGSVCIIVGDVVGSGLAAATTMGWLRTVFRAHALGSARSPGVEDPAELLTTVDHHLRYYEPSTMTTVVCAILDTATSRMSISTAGHPPPVIATPLTPAALLDIPPDTLLGVEPRMPRRTSRFTLEPGTSICFYTDGLVERRNASIDDGLDKLLRAMPVAPPEIVCATVMAQMVGREQVNDDIAVLAMSIQLTR